MLFSSSLPTSLLSLLAVTLIQPVAGGLIPDLLRSLEDLQNIAKRCDNSCGYYGQLCCASNEVCFTDTNGQAQCGAGVAAITQVAATAAAVGNWQYYTTTYVQTDLKTVTATFSSLVAVATGSSCSYAHGQTPCGNMCCNSGQYCQQAGMCMAVPGSSGYYSGLATVTVTNTASAALRPTTNTILTLTSTGGAVSTAPFQTPVGTGGATSGLSQSSSGGGLSGGAIAGIVIGVILGLMLLILLCLCCCAKGLLDGVLGIFGLGGRRRTRREEVEVIEERRHQGAGGRTWYGAARPSGSVTSEKRKKDSGLGGFAKATLFLGGLAAILGLKRKNDRRNDKSGSGSSYYDSEYYTSSSSSSSGGRTRSRSRSRI